MLSRSSYTGIVPPPGVFREFGVSAVTLARNEEDWAETSVLSILDFVDEVLVADHKSEDGTAGVLRALAKKHPGKVRFLSIEDDDFVDANNRMLALAKWRWVLRWHADFVARTSGESSIAHLVENVRHLDPMRYYSISLSGITLDGDLEHQFPGGRDRPEPFLFTHSPWLRFYPRGGWESLHVPWFYTKLAWSDAYYFHLRSVKPAMRMLQKLYWSDWFKSWHNGQHTSLSEFIRVNATRDFGTATVEEAALKFVVEEFQGCVPYQEQRHGAFPDLLRPLLIDPPFRLVYESGRVVGRVERPTRSLAARSEG